MPKDTVATKGRESKERFCCYCGESMGAYADYDRMDTCGERECERFVREEMAAEREDAHNDLDERMGW